MTLVLDSWADVWFGVSMFVVVVVLVLGASDIG